MMHPEVQCYMLEILDLQLVVDIASSAFALTRPQMDMVALA